MVNGDRGKPRTGIVFLGGEGPSPAQCRALVEAARTPGGDPLMAAADSGLLLAEAAGISPHWIIGDMDSLGPGAEHRLSAYPPETILRYPADKDYTDGELAFSLLREKGCGTILLAGGGGGRLDHLLAVRAFFERENPPSRWMTANEDIRCLEAPELFAGSGMGPVSVFPLGNGPWAAESSGLTWPLAGLPWTRGFFGLSNEAPDGNFTIRVKQGRFLVVMPFP